MDLFARKLEKLKTTKLSINLIFEKEKSVVILGYSTRQLIPPLIITSFC